MQPPATAGTASTHTLDDTNIIYHNNDTRAEAPWHEATNNNKAENPKQRAITEDQKNMTVRKDRVVMEEETIEMPTARGGTADEIISTTISREKRRPSPQRIWMLI